MELEDRWMDVRMMGMIEGNEGVIKYFYRGLLGDCLMENQAGQGVARTNCSEGCVCPSN